MVCYWVDQGESNTAEGVYICVCVCISPIYIYIYGITTIPESGSGSSGACFFSMRTCVCACVRFDIKQLMQGAEQGTEQCSARKMLVSRGNLLQLPTGFNASEVNERKCNPDFLAVTRKAGCVGSSYRLRSQEFLWW